MNFFLNNRMLLKELWIADNFLSRLKGLMGKKNISIHQGLLITRCNSIHMYFMHVPLDIIFLKKITDQVYEVSSFHENILPWKLFPLFDAAATDTLEVGQGFLLENPLKRRDQMCLK